MIEKKRKQNANVFKVVSLFCVTQAKPTTLLVKAKWM